MKRLVMVLLVGWTLSGLAAQNDELRGEYVMDLVLETSAMQVLGDRRIVPIIGGEFSGPDLNGTILPGGADWIRQRPDGVSELDVRMTLKTDGGALIYLTYAGLIAREPPREGSPRGGIYWRMVPRFETDAEEFK